MLKIGGGYMKNKIFYNIFTHSASRGTFTLNKIFANHFSGGYM